MAKQRNMNILETFPPNVPQKLIDEYREVVATYNMSSMGGGQRKLAAHLGVNMKYVNDLLTKGIEPTVKTKKGREVRRKLFLPTDTKLENKGEVVEVLRTLRQHIDELLNRLE